MPVTPTYPGVYIEELPSGVHTITGVATSIAAFVGWAPQGPTTQAQLVQSWSDYSNRFGGLDTRSPMSYAVNQFFTNGGTQAYIIRLIDTVDAPPAAAATITSLSPLTVSALNAGIWGNSYSIAIKNPSPATGRFRLQVWYTPTGTPTPAPVMVESWENLTTVAPDPLGRNVMDVINNGSNIITVSVPTGTTTLPADTGTTLVALANGNDGTVLTPNNANFETALLPSSGTGGVYLLNQVDLFNLLCVPGETTGGILSKLEGYCETNHAFLIADPDPNVIDYTKVTLPAISGAGGNAAFYFPQVQAADPLNQNALRYYPPCGFVAGVYAATDASRGVWKAPAGTATGLIGATGVQVALNDAQNGTLNPLGVNCIRNFAAFGTVVWGARTTQGNDEIGSQWKYIPIRRLALFLEVSLYRGTQWAVFEPNDEPLWGQIRMSVGSFMQTLFKQGAFQGSSPQQAYFVKCDSETTTSTDQDNGIVNILVGFAPLKPAEFVILQIQQMAGQTGS